MGFFDWLSSLFSNKDDSNENNSESNFSEDVVDIPEAHGKDNAIDQVAGDLKVQNESITKTPEAKEELQAEQGISNTEVQQNVAEDSSTTTKSESS